MTAVAAPGPAPARAVRPARLGWGTVVTGAFVVTLLRPITWALGLLGFLAGGGLLLVAWPILVLPTPTGLQNLLAGPVTSLAFGTMSTSLALLITGLIAGLAVLVIVGTVVGAWAERQAIGIALEAATEDGLDLVVPPLDGAPGTWRVAAIRLLSLLPVLAVAAASWRAVYDVTYHELILPRDLVTPLPIRVLGQLPGPLLGIALAWLLSDAAAAVAVRRLVFERRSVVAAWLLGWVVLVRRVHRILPTALVGVALQVLLVGPAMVAAAVGWARVREILESDREPVVVLGATLVWVAIWLGGLVLAGVAAAVRAATWTLETPLRVRLPEPGTGAGDAASGSAAASSSPG